MKSYGASLSEGQQFETLIIPFGKTLPRGVRQGEIFQLVADMAEPENPMSMNAWYPKGTYISNGLTWDKLNDSMRHQVSNVIGSQLIENEKIGNLNDAPVSTDGEMISHVTIQPAHSKSIFSGHGTFWTSLSKSGNVWVCVFRNKTLVGLTADYVEQGKAKSMSFSFYDVPPRPTHEPIIYYVRICTDQVARLFVNRTNNIMFDARGSSAFTVSENA